MNTCIYYEAPMESLLLRCVPNISHFLVNWCDSDKIPILQSLSQLSFYSVMVLLKLKVLVHQCHQLVAALACER